MPYLFVTDADGVSEETVLGPDDITDVIEGDLKVYRFRDGHFEEFTPIDEADLDNWSNVL